ncbi:MAG: hypothetical protein HZB20_11105 [Chloroflexi bacterium]|nr:hypothetical protein [Chloroflexota bacterium]
MLTLSHVLEALTGVPLAGGRQVVTDAVIDSRLAIPGALFVALVCGRGLRERGGGRAGSAG